MEDYSDFPVTRWSLVVKAAEGDEAGAREALDRLLRLYLPALRAHLVFHRHLRPDDADELVSGFVSDQVVGRDLIQRASEQRGRFRAFLIVSLGHYVASRARYDRRMKRWGGTAASLDEANDVVTPAAGADAFDVAWAREVIAEAIRRIQADYRFRGRTQVWDVFEARVLNPILHNHEPVPCAELIQRLGFHSPMQVSNALAAAKRSFVRTLREVVAEYAGDGAVEEELADLKRILATSRAI